MSAPMYPQIGRGKQKLVPMSEETRNRLVDLIENNTALCRAGKPGYLSLMDADCFEDLVEHWDLAAESKCG